MTFKIRTHNPIISLLIIVVGIFLPFWYISERYGNGIKFISFIILYFVVELITYYLFGRKTTVTVTERGIIAKWMQYPFYVKTKKEILWTEIESWYFDNYKGSFTFSLTTKDKNTYLILCLASLIKQPQLYEFLDHVSYEIDLYNRQQINAIYKIINARKSMNKTIKIFLIIAVSIMTILFIFVLFDLRF